MSWTDHCGVTHPSMGDEISPWGYAHIACCRPCISRFGHISQFAPIGPIPVENIGIPPAPTGRAKHRKEDQ